MYLENYVHVYMVMLVTEIVFLKNIFSLPVSPGENTGMQIVCVAEVHNFEHVGGQLERKFSCWNKPNVYNGI